MDNCARVNDIINDLRPLIAQTLEDGNSIQFEREMEKFKKLMSVINQKFDISTSDILENNED